MIAQTTVAARRVDSTFRTLQAADAAIEAANADLEYQTQRWESFALVEGDLTEGQQPVTILDQLLDSQQRLANAESVFAQSEMEFKIAEIELKRALGLVLTYSNVPDGTDGNSTEPSATERYRPQQ